MKWSEAVRLQESLDWSTPQRIAPIPTVPDASNALECTVCQITLASVAEASAHRLSKAHTGNLRRKLQGLPPLVLLPSVSTSSLSDSSSSDSSSEDDSEEAVTPLTTEEPDLLVSSSGSPFVQVTILRSHTGLFWDAPIDSKTSRLTLKIYKQLLLSSRDQSRTDLSMDIVKKELNIICTPSHTWTLLMVASGHFAGAVIDASGKTLVHKTHHRYTTRRKQGGGQAGKDGSGKIANSAGSTLRRYNEQALKVMQSIAIWS